MSVTATPFLVVRMGVGQHPRLEMLEAELRAVRRAQAKLAKKEAKLLVEILRLKRRVANE